MQPSKRASVRLPLCDASRSAPPPRRGFTLVEMLVVITILSMLAALTIPVVWQAVIRGKNAAIVIELNQLEGALTEYKNRYGEYPPDFSGLLKSTDTDYDADARTAMENAVLRHLAKAFPRYQPGVSTNGAVSGFAGFLADVQNGWHINGNDSYTTASDVSTKFNVHLLSPASALTFWIGGRPEWQTRTVADSDNSVIGSPIYPGQSAFDKDRPVKGFLGFSADPRNPFDTTATGTLDPTATLDIQCVAYRGDSGDDPGGIFLWPTSACDKALPYPFVYFRAASKTYIQENSDPSKVVPKACGRVRPAIDTRFNDWVNKTSFQIFCAGLNGEYGALRTSGAVKDRLQFPTAENYGRETFDDLTNFSNGTLKDQIPQ